MNQGTAAETHYCPSLTAWLKAGLITTRRLSFSIPKRNEYPESLVSFPALMSPCLGR